VQITEALGFAFEQSWIKILPDPVIAERNWQALN
jgi:hypothetical protein